ncbi:MAG: DUF3413 domain-containing protein [Salinivirgaceae bacterium]|nr:DUF3413 domain-containing protein [Salinivirgaceae bacterium]
MKEKLQNLFINYLIITFLLSAILFFSTTANCGVSLNLLSVLYILFSTVCHSAIVMLAPGIISLLLVFLFPKNKTGEITLAIIASLIQIVAVVDYFVFAFYRFHINGFVLSLLTGPAASQIFVFDAVLILKSAAIVAVVSATNLLLILKAAKPIGSRICKKRYLIIGLVVCAIGANAMHAYGAATLNRQIIKCTEAIPYYYPLRANRMLDKLGIVDLQKIQTTKVDSGVLNYPKAELVWNDTITPPNIIMIMIDSWNRRVFNAETSPNIMDFSSRCVNYSKHVSSSNGTQGSVFTIFTSLSSYYWQDFEMNNISPIFSDRLKELDYDVQTFPGASLRSPAFNRVLLNNFPNINTDTEGKTVYDRDCNLTHNFIAYLDSSKFDRPFFAWLFYDLAHSFEMPKERLWKFQPSWEFADYTKLSRDMDPEPFFNLYQNAVYQVDSLVAMALREIENKGLLSNSIILICGDHGQEFNDNNMNFWGHNGNFSDIQIGTNFLWYSPDCQPQTINYKTSHYDLCPTLLKQYLGLESDCKDFGCGKMLSDSTYRDWLLVGSRENFAFIHKNHIYEKRPSGYFFATDEHLNELPHDSIDYGILNEQIKKIGSFYK